MDEILFQVMTGLKIHLGVRSRGEIQKKEILQTITIREAQEEISSFVILLLLFYFVVKIIYYIKHNRKMKQIYKINWGVWMIKHKSFAFMFIDILISDWSFTLDIK